MGQIRHGSATTPHATRAAIQRSAGYGQGASRPVRPQSEDGGEVEEARLHPRCRDGPKEPRSTVLTNEEEALAVAFRKHTCAAARRLPLRLAGHHPASKAVGPAPAVSAPWHQQAARGRRRQDAEEKVQALPDRLLSYGHRRGENRGGQAAPPPRHG